MSWSISIKFPNLLSLEKFVNNLLGRNDIKDALKSLDTLTMEEARMVNAETLNVTHKVDDKVTELIDGEKNAILWVFTHP